MVPPQGCGNFKILILIITSSHVKKISLPMASDSFGSRVVPLDLFRVGKVKNIDRILINLL